MITIAQKEEFYRKWLEGTPPAKKSMCALDYEDCLYYCRGRLETRAQLLGELGVEDLLVQYTPTWGIRITELMSSGFSAEEAATSIGLPIPVLNTWLQGIPEFAAAILKAKNTAHAGVVTSLYKRATERIIPLRSTTVMKGPDGKIITDTETITERHVPADMAAVKFVLTNKMSDEWKDTVVPNNEAGMGLILQHIKGQAVDPSGESFAEYDKKQAEHDERHKST